MRAYLDWNATTPPCDEALQAMESARRRAWANPSSVHGAGRAARAELEGARETVARALHVDPRDVYFTSGGTEANNLALTACRRDAALVVSAIEHPSVLRPAEVAGAHVVPVDASGRISPEALSAVLGSIDGDVGLVSVQAANHETGVRQPLEALAEVAHARGALFHTDAIQAFAKVDEPGLFGADLVTITGHKIRGPKGIGALAVRAGARLGAVLRGGGQERGVRPGTQDATLASGFGAAVARASCDAYASLAVLRDRFERGVIALGGIVNGDGPRLPHVTNLSFSTWGGPELLAALDLEGVAVSSGAACSAGTLEPSPIVEAMAGRARAASAIRVSMGDATTDREVDFALERFASVLRRGPISSAPRGREFG